jgi:hypothetical protein
MLRIAVELAALRGGAKDAQAYRYNNAAGITSSTSCTSIDGADAHYRSTASRSREILR